MLSRSTWASFLALLIVVCLPLAACGPTPEPQTIIQTVPVEVTKIVKEAGEEKTIVVTEVVEVQITPTPLPPTPEPPPAEPETYRMAIFADLTTTNYWAYMDPDSSVWNAYVLTALGYPSFWDLRYPDILFVPEMATVLPQPIVQQGDFWVQTIEIRQGVVWSDGEPVTVHDFIFTGETVRDFGLGGNWLSAFDFDYIDRFEAVDDYTIKIFYSQQPGLSVSQVGGIGFASWMPRHFWADAVEECQATEEPDLCLYAADGSQAPSMGEFAFKTWESGAYAEVTARDDAFFNDTARTFYADGSYQEVGPNHQFCVHGGCGGEVKLEYASGPHVPSVVYSVYGTQDAAVLALANGEVDFLLNPLGLQRGLREQVVGNPGLGAFQNRSNGFRYLAFNMRKSPNDVKEFRKAVAYLINKEYLTDRVLQGTALPVYAMVPEGNPYWHNPDTAKLGYGLERKERFEKAMELLKAGGFSWDVEPTWDEEDGVIVPGSTIKGPDGTMLEEIELLAPSAGYDPMRATAAIWIEQWCQEVGIPVKANPTGFNTILPLVFEPDPATGEIEFDWYILGWSLGNPALTMERAREYVFAMDAKLAEDVPYVTLFTSPILEFYAKARVSYPFTEALDGLQNLNGTPDLVTSH